MQIQKLAHKLKMWRLLKLFSFYELNGTSHSVYCGSSLFWIACWQNMLTVPKSTFFWLVVHLISFHYFPLIRYNLPLAKCVNCVNWFGLKYGYFLELKKNKIRVHTLLLEPSNSFLPFYPANTEEEEEEILLCLTNKDNRTQSIIKQLSKHNLQLNTIFKHSRCQKRQMPINAGHLW